MKITVNNAVFLHELRILSKIAPSKPTLAVLGHVKIVAELMAPAIELTATDLEVGFVTSCAAQVEQPGAITIPAKTLVDMLERLRGDAEVTIDATSGKTLLTCGAFQSRLPGLEVKDYPTVAQVEGDVARLNAQALSTLIDRTAYSMSDKATQHSVVGALLSLAGPVMAMVALDGKRLSIATANREPGADRAVIVPTKTLDVLQTNMSTGTIDFSASDRHLFFVSGARTLVSRTVDGQFPAYQRAVPKANKIQISLDRLDLASAIRRVGLVSEIMMFRFTPGKLDLVSRSADRGDAGEELAVPYGGEGYPEEIKLYVLWEHVLDFLDKAVEPRITMALKTPETPVLLTAGADFINVVLTIRP